MLRVFFRFRRHGGHSRTHRWLDPVANDPPVAASHPSEHPERTADWTFLWILRLVYRADIQGLMIMCFR